MDIVVCPGHCYWDHHVLNDFRYVDEEVTVVKQYADLKKKYGDAKIGKASAESMILKIKEEVKSMVTKVHEDLDKAKPCLEHLEEIALRPNPLIFEQEYVDHLIESEKAELKPGWKVRVEYFEKFRGMAKITASSKEGKMPQHMNLEVLVNDDVIQEKSPGKPWWQVWQ